MDKIDRKIVRKVAEKHSMTHAEIRDIAYTQFEFVRRQILGNGKKELATTMLTGDTPGAMLPYLGKFLVKPRRLLYYGNSGKERRADACKRVQRLEKEQNYSIQELLKMEILNESL